MFREVTDRTNIFFCCIKKRRRHIKDFLVVFVQYVQSFHKQYQISMDHTIINENHEKLLENDDDRKYYSLLSNVQQKLDLYKQKNNDFM